MICYKKILIIFFSFISFASANVEVLEKLNKVLPLEEKLINNNQIYRVKIQSDLSEEELKALENKKINDVMFVMKYNEDRTFRIFVTDPPKKDKKEKEEFDVVFDRSSFDYRPTNKDQNQDFITFDDNYNILDDISKMKIIGIYIISFILATLLLALIVFLTLKILKEKKKKKTNKT